ncbi:hypothetical protein, partial [Bacillus thuringiensis]|uniref:hypothetical protein n=1 Tax=Bacillus thuringiensis TaxID=1428 RepID=UPI000ECFE13D
MNIIIYDIKNFVKKNVFKWFYWCVSLLVLCVLSIITLKSENQVNSSLDLWFYLFIGSRDYTSGIIELPPFSWLLIQAFLAFLVGDYLYNELKENSFYALLRVKKRHDWFLAKIIWLIFTVMLFYITILICLILSSFYLDSNINMWGNYSKNIFKSHLVLSMNPLKFFILSFFSCFITSLVISLVQVLLTLIIKPIYSYIFIIVMLLISIYVSSPILLGRYLMVIRYIEFFSNGFFE